VEGLEYFDNPSDDYLLLKGRYSHIEGFRVLNTAELPPGVKFGTRYWTYVINPQVYLEWLEKSLNDVGVKFIRRSLESLEDAFNLVNDTENTVVINCTGFGFNDPAVFPTRGKFLT
jgi:D-amino-acid oxidase